VAGALIFIAVGIVRPVVAMYAARTLGYPPGVVGAILFAQVVPAFAGVGLGALIRGAGPGRVTLVSGLVMAVCGGLFLIARGVVVLVAVQVLASAAGLAAWISAQTYLTTWADGPNLARIVGLFGFWTGLGIAAGPLLGAFLLDVGGPGAGFAGYATAGAAMALLATRLPRLPVPAQASVATPTLPRLWALLRCRPVQAAFMFSSLGIAVATIRSTFYLVFLTERGWSAAAVGVLMAAGGGAAMLVRPVMATMVARMGMAGVIFAGSIAAAVGLGVTPLLHHYGLLLALSILGGLGAGLHQPVGLALVAEATSLSERSITLGLRSMVNQVAVSGAPFLFGFAAQWIGTGGAFYLIGMLTLALGVWAWKLIAAKATEVGYDGHPVGTTIGAGTPAGRFEP
jgi:MFS family permease